MLLAEAVYAATSCFPDAERFGITAQLRRAAVSVPSNIAEGWGRGRRNEYAHFVRIARGSLCEIETQLMLGHRLGMLTTEHLSSLLDRTDRTSRLLLNLLRALIR